MEAYGIDFENGDAPALIFGRPIFEAEICLVNCRNSWYNRKRAAVCARAACAAWYSLERRQLRETLPGGACPGRIKMEVIRQMELTKIASFTVDHTKLQKGIYLSRQDGDVRTWDLRMKRPNQGDYLANGALHTMEHLFATFARSSKYRDGVIYVGPMGCRTGFYLLTRELSDEQVLALVKDSFAFMSGYEGEIPGARIEECGNYLDQDLEGCRREAASYLEAIRPLTERDMYYPGECTR